MKGKLYGIGVGPGDPELLTLKAIRIMKTAKLVALPKEEGEKSIAYQIALPVCPELANKELLSLPLIMTKDKKALKKAYDESQKMIEDSLSQGKDVVFLTLGDPTIYSTYLYVHKRVEKAGYETEIISGIPSFCAVAARFGIGLAEREEQLHIIPASYQVEEALNLPGTKVLMKAGRKLAKVKEILSRRKEEVLMIENCGMDSEKIYRGIEEIPEKSGYYSLLIVKEKKE